MSRRSVDSLALVVGVDQTRSWLPASTPVMCVNDPVEWQGFPDRDAKGVGCSGCGEVCCCLEFGFDREVVATQETDGRVVEEHRPEGKLGPIASGGVGGTDRADLDDGGVQVDVLGERDLDDARRS